MKKMTKGTPYKFSSTLGMLKEIVGVWTALAEELEDVARAAPDRRVAAKYKIASKGLRTLISICEKLRSKAVAWHSSLRKM